MINKELELDYKQILNSSDINGITMIWKPSESKLIVDDKITDIIEKYNVEDRTLEQLLK